MTDMEFYMNTPIAWCWFLLVTAQMLWCVSWWQRHDRVLGTTLFVTGVGAYLVSAIWFIVLAIIKAST